MHRLYQEVQASFADLTEVVRERFAGIRIIKAYNRERDATDKLKTISREYVGKNLGLVKITGSFFPMMVLFSNLGLAIVLFLGGRQTIYTTITTGDFVAFISYLGLLTWPMMAMGWVVNLIQRGTASLDRINKILETRPEINDIPDAVSIKTVRDAIVLDNVTFSYEPDTSPVLTGIDLTVRHGHTLGIVGPPGSGKTTLLSLIPRIFDTSQGRILIDSTDIRDMRISDLRSQISFMPQEPFLFAGTIRENIAFENRRTDTNVLMKATEDANLTTTIQSFPNEFETVVGEKGVILSGGQKQRIALARALLKETPILILDDPVSQVDMETGSAIINTIRAVAGQRTVFIVSHRISAVQHADTIIVLNNGRIVESGTHEELLEQNRYYAQTFRLQEIEEEGYNGN
jgi:ATP-binding cassette subfamily B multidrug efflux pump